MVRNASVVYPIYGEFSIERLMMAVESAMYQQYNRNDVIVSEGGLHPRLEGLLPRGVKYVFTPSDEVNGKAQHNTGLVRNRGVLLADNPLIYANDADIVFLSDYFIRDSIEYMLEAGASAAKWPPMKRVHKQDLGRMQELFGRLGNNIGAEAEIGDFYVRFPGTEEREVVVHSSEKEYGTERVTAFREDFDRYVNDKGLRGVEPVIWAGSDHKGGTLMLAEAFYSAGGYSESFINWGGEDLDIQDKLARLYKVITFPRERRFFVAHLDHGKPYLIREEWEKNKRILEERQGTDIGVLAERDAKNLNSAGRQQDE